MDNDTKNENRKRSIGILPSLCLRDLYILFCINAEMAERKMDAHIKLELVLSNLNPHK
jgi:hypothetical protein